MSTELPKNVGLGGSRLDSLRKIRAEQAERVTSLFYWKIVSWHYTVNPDVIILTATSATPYGYLIKSAWASAYPGHKQPKFYNIDPRQFPEAGLKHNVGGTKEFAMPSPKSLTKSDTILVFDEYPYIGRESTEPHLQHLSDKDVVHGNSIRTIADYLIERGFPPENIWTDEGEQELHDIVTSECREAGTWLRSPLKRTVTNEGAKLSIAEPGLHRNTSREFMADLKLLGQKIGRKIKDSQKLKQ